MRVYICFLFVVFSYTAVAQSHPGMVSITGVGGNGAENIFKSAVKTIDGGFILHMETSSGSGSGNIDSFCTGNKREIFLKYNSSGEAINWKKCYGFSGDSFLLHIFPLADGSTVLGGMFNSSTNWGLLITKHDASDNILWQHSYSKGGGSQLRAMIPTEDGGYIMMGETYNTDTNVIVHHGSWMDADLWVLKVDSDGNKVWSKVIGGSYPELGIALVPAPGDGCYVVGATQSSDYDCTGYHSGGQDAYLVRLDRDGNILWHKCAGGSGYEGTSNSGNATSNEKGGVLMTISTSSSDGDVQHHINLDDYWVLNVDSNGSIVWENCYDNGGNEYPSSICMSADGNIWLNGWANSANEDAFIVHLDSAGSLLNSVVLTSTGQDHGQIIYPLNNGNVLAGGYYSSSDGSYSSLVNYGNIDIFMAVFAPWSEGIEEKLVPIDFFKIFPNPAHSTLNIERLKYQEKREKYLIRVKDMATKVVYNGCINKGENVLTIDLINIAKGIYTIEIADDKERVIQIRKMVLD